MTETMKAYVLEEFDAPARIGNVPVPVTRPREVRVRVRTSSVNPVDAAVVRGFFRAMYEYRLPAIQGRDFAGTVDAVGTEVTAFAPGDEVFGMVKRDYIGDGTFAEFVVVDADRFVVTQAGCRRHRLRRGTRALRASPRCSASTPYNLEPRRQRLHQRSHPEE